MLDLVGLYQRSPYSARCAIASGRGAYLRAWRYSRRTEALAQAVIARESWSRERWVEWADLRLDAMLAASARDVPYYRDLWQDRLDGGADPRRLTDWPVLAKQDLRTAGRRLLESDTQPRYAEHTSGTSGSPVTIWFDRRSYVEWYAHFEARWRWWYGVRRTDRWAILGGQPVVRIDAANPPYWVWNAAMRQLYLSSYHVSGATAASYLEALRRYRVTYLWGYPSTMHALAAACRANRLTAPRMKVVISNAEPLLDHQRELLATVFQCPVRETYGMAEAVLAASECEAGQLHLWPDAGHAEVLRTIDSEAARGSTGRLVGTGFVNRLMPLVRYDTGDAGRIDYDAECDCGRRMPILASVEGRVDDLVHTADGRTIGRLDPVFKADLPILRAQIIQRDFDVFEVLIQPDRGFTDSDSEVVAGRLRERVGEVRVETRLVDDIPLGPSGKFKAVVSEVGGPAG